MGNTLVQLKVILLRLQGNHAFDGLNLAKRVVEGKFSKRFITNPYSQIYSRQLNAYRTQTIPSIIPEYLNLQRKLYIFHYNMRLFKLNMILALRKSKRIIRPLPYSIRDCHLCGRSSGVERNLAKVEVVGSNPIARSIFCSKNKKLSLR